MNHTLYRLSILIIIILMTGCQTISPEPSGPQATITGKAAYRERIALPDGATLTVRLERAAIDDATNSIIAESHQDLTTSPPYTFTLTYPQNKIDPTREYFLHATIKVDEKPAFSGTLPLTLEEATTINMPLQKVFQKISNTNPQVTLENTYWKLLTVAGQNVPMVETSQPHEPFIQFNSISATARGFSSCNIFSASYVIDQNELQFGPLLSTMKVCADSLNIEKKFHLALRDTYHFAIEAKTLSFYSEDKKVIATLTVSK